jgi:hypothetical protein
MIKITGRTPFGVVEYTVSSEAEVEKLPTTVGHGSTAFVMESSSVYMFDEEDKTWKQI